MLLHPGTPKHTKLQTTSIQGLTHTGERQTRSRAASHPETPNNPLDTCMDHSKHSLDTWAPKILRVHSNPLHRTNERLASIHLSDAKLCNQCGKMDTLQHWIRDCGEEAIIRNMTSIRIAALLRIDPRYIPGDWTIRPYFHFWPPQRQAAIVWIIAHLVVYRMQRKRLLTLNDFIDFLRRAKWKAYQKSPRQHRVGNCLDIWVY